MSIKLLFHALAIISGVIAGGCALLSSHNRIVLFVVFALISGIFELATHFLGVEIPELDCSIASLPLNYAEGLQIDGIVWEKDFREYTLRVRNKSKQVDAYDLRIDMDMLGAIVKYNISSQQGCEEIFFSRNPPSRFGRAEKGVITETTKLHSNNFEIIGTVLFSSS